ncbi:hypothetical protein FMM05_12565 [Flavobacterium zepuense]|uniref:Peptidase family M50 n=1 Tax=Flavobacterium zepuense TaxID=2593302 RepID=A0A552V0I3_9FLAO|nr:hypothetical protein [Flavobacterium zepuense]TRW23984.1 hypothetical protein FMM05_12565 [Flavobacterium zepuense]
MFATIIGTQTHEYGHYLVGKYYGYNPKLHYASVSYGDYNDKQLAKFDSLYKADEIKILAKENSPQKEYFLKYRAQLSGEMKGHDFENILAGPLQTMLSGSIGLLILWLNRKKIRAKTALSFKNWVAVFVAFLWSRQLAILLQKIVYTIANIQTKNKGDEVNLAKHLNLNPWSILTVLGVISAIILIWIVFYIIPKQQRFTFIIAGFAGSALGVLIWFGWIGPVLLP